MSASVAEFAFLGRIHTPYATVAACPRHPWTQPMHAVIEVHEMFGAIIEGIPSGSRAHVLWWAHRADRGLRSRRLSEGTEPLGVCVGRGVDRPNPIGLTLVEVLAVHARRLTVRGMDCLDGSPLIDIKPALTLPDHTLQ
ncbi:MAG: TrmO family methyltransferase domain-containing protein [Nocardioides sp.]